MNYLFLILLIVNLSANSPIIIYVDWTSYPLQSIYFSFSDQLPSWVIFLILILSNDIELNPGDHLNKGFLSLCTWNLNTISKNNFQRVSLLEGHNALHNYDIISLCETILNDTIELPDELLPNYTFISCNSPSGKKQGLFFKETLPLKVRNDLSFDECIVVELIFGRKHIFYTVLYRNPINKSGSTEFRNFLDKLESLYTKIKNENPYLVLFSGDFNGHCQTWWPEGDSNSEGVAIHDLRSYLGPTQLVSEPTNFQDNCAPSCIDLLFCEQPNVVTQWYSFIS